MAEVAENANATTTNDNVQEVAPKEDAKKGAEVKQTQLEKKYTDEDVNNISTKNVNKALEKQLKELGIDDVEEAKSILSKAREEKEKNKSVDEKTQEIIDRANKQTLKAMNMTIENALLRKHVDDVKVSRVSKLVEKENIMGKDGEIDENKLNSEIEAILKDFPELVSQQENLTTGFKIGSDGKADEKPDELEEMKKVMGLIK